jgi:HEAT repeat protein
MNEQQAAPPVLSAAAAADLTDFARACKAAARAVSLYPDGHPAIAFSLDRLVQVTARLTSKGPYRLQVHADTLLVDGAAMAKPDSAVIELAELLHRHLIGALSLNAATDVSSWRTLLRLLARAPEDIRSDGGIAKLWAAAGGPSVEIQEIDYAEVLREKQGLETKIEEIIAAALAGPRLELDDSAMETLLEIVQDPEKLELLMKQLDKATSGPGVDAKTGAFLSLLRGLTEYATKHAPERLESIFSQMGRAAGRLSAEQMLHLLAQRHQPDAMAGSINVVTAVVDRMSDDTVANFVAGSVIAEMGASQRLAHAFQALVPDTDKRRQLLSLAQAEVSASELGDDESFPQLWESVETMLTSYSDDKFVSDEYARELSSARTQAVDVERTSDDPPERLAAWLATVTDTSLRSLDHQLLLDLLRIEEDALRWRDIADTAVTHADDLVRVGQFDVAWQLAEAVADEGARIPARSVHAATALERFGRGAMMKHVAAHLRGASDDSAARVRRICHAIGTTIIPSLAEVLSAEQDARSRRRLREILLAFGAQGRESVQQLMNASNWEVRRTAAFLLREFGGSEGLKELVPLLTDNEPLVQREAVQALVFNGSEEAAQMLLTALSKATGRARDGLVKELTTLRDERAAPFFAYLLRHLDRRRSEPLYIAALEALGASGGRHALDALKQALYDGDWWAPGATKRLRTTAAQSLRKIGTPEALTVLNDAAEHGSRGVKAIAKAELARLG